MIINILCFSIGLLIGFFLCSCLVIAKQADAQLYKEKEANRE